MRPGASHSDRTQIRETIERIVSQGILVRNGIIVGFDHDGPEIFDVLFEFLQSAPLPTPVISTLTASVGTPLYARMQKEGRLIENEQRWIEGLTCNFIPKRTTRERLLMDAWAFARRLFEPAAFEHRTMNFIKMFGSGRSTETSRAPRTRATPNWRSAYAMACIRNTSARGAAEAAMVSRLLQAATKNPSSMRSVITSLVFYEQYQVYFEDYSKRKELAA